MSTLLLVYALTGLLWWCCNLAMGFAHYQREWTTCTRKAETVGLVGGMFLGGLLCISMWPAGLLLAIVAAVRAYRR